MSADHGSRAKVSAGIESAARREANLRQLELVITRRLDGLLHGEHQAFAHGPGWEAGEGRAYQPGDDARRIDWNLTARSHELHVRNTIAERELETWLVVDTTPSLDFGTAMWEKRDLALVAAAAFGLLGARAGNRIAAVLFDLEATAIVPPRGGRDAVMQLLRRIDRTPAVTAGQCSRPGAPGLADAIRRTRSTARRRGRIVVITDLIDDGPWADELRAAGTRHDTVLVEVSDPREWSLPPVGLVTLVDPESGRRLEVQTSDRRVRERFDRVAAERQDHHLAAVRASGARHLRLSTDRDWMADLVRFAKRAGAPAPASASAVGTPS